MGEGTAGELLSTNDSARVFSPRCASVVGLWEDVLGVLTDYAFAFAFLGSLMNSTTPPVQLIATGPRWSISQ